MPESEKARPTSGGGTASDAVKAAIIQLTKPKSEERTEPISMRAPS